MNREEAIRIIKSHYPANKQMLNEALEFIIPELKSEDEKIRKEIIEYIKTGTYYKSWITWLEKQGESDETNAKKFLINKGYPIDANGTFPTYEDMYSIIKDGLEKHGEIMDINPSEFDLHLNRLLKQFETLPKEELASSLEFYLNVVENDGTYKADEKQGEPKTADNIEPKDYNSIDPHFSKPIDNYKPKFKVGQWVIDNLGNMWRIDSFDKKNYQVSDSKESYNYLPISKQDEMHLWTLKDAKNGDILVNKYGRPFIFKDLSDSNHPNAPVAYCGINSNNIFNISTSKWWTTDKVYPATRKQRNLLLQKMIEAGYEFNFEKKELKKIKKESITYEWIEDYWQREKVNNPNSYDKGEKIQFDHQGFMEFCIKYCKKPVEWRNEDENMFKSILDYGDLSIAQIEWLKFIKHIICNH